MIKKNQNFQELKAKQTEVYVSVEGVASKTPPFVLKMKCNQY